MDIASAIQFAAERHLAGRLEEAVQVYRDILKIDAGCVDAHAGLGDALRSLGRLDEATRSYANAVALKPDFSDAHYILANTLKELGRLEEAELRYRQVLALKPDYVEAHNNRGIVLADMGFLDDAAASYRQALTIKPDHAAAYNNLGNILRELGRHEEAEQLYVKTLALKPDLAEALNHHGNALLDLGRLVEAERSYRRALTLAPDLASAHSNLLLLLNYLPDRPPEAIRVDALDFGRRFGQIPMRGGHRNIVDAARRLRIGYVSADFRVHSVASFFEPILAAHDRIECEIYCYYNFPRADAVTRRLQSYPDHWRDVFGMDDQSLVERVREDAIDILVDLSGHTAGNRLTAFALKPAPVQVTYLGYPATSGLAEIDYRLTDAIADPPGENDRRYAERLVRLPQTMWCYRADGNLAEVGLLPCRNGGGVTFGSFNYFAKLNPEVIALWSRLLARLPDSKLVVTRLPGEETANGLRRRFEASGIPASRLELHCILSRAQLVELFGRVDIALDPFPYAGTTTTCEVMWMGIPAVTLAGSTSASRSGASLLCAVGLEDLVADTGGQYLDIAEGLALDPGRLAAIRGSLRERMRASPLMHSGSLARNLEAAYRTMWQSWCRKQQT